MFARIRGLSRDPVADWKRVITGPTLGELRLNDDATWWDGAAAIGDASSGHPKWEWVE